MSRNFEDEYRDMMLSDIPDLWDRIERKLPEKTATPIVEIPSQKKRASRKKPLMRPSTVKYMAGIAACLVLICLAGPVMDIVRDSSAGEYTKSQMNADGTDSDAFGNDTYFATDGTIMENAEENRADNGDAQTGAPANGIDMALMPQQDTVTEISDFLSLDGAETDSEVEEGATSDTAESTQSEETDGTGEETDAGLPASETASEPTNEASVERIPDSRIAAAAIPAVTYTNLPITVLSSKKSGTETIFTVNVSKENTSGLAVDTELQVKITDTQVGELKTGRNYTVTLISDDTTSDQQIYIVDKILK